jgi:hypothetical protein
MLKILVGLLFVGVGLAMNEDFVKKLDLSSSKTELALKAILKEWDVKDYPNFLKSCFMHKSSWEIMKYKLMQRVLTASVSKTRKNFVASFLGRWHFLVHIVSDSIVNVCFLQLRYCRTRF